MVLKELIALLRKIMPKVSVIIPLYVICKRFFKGLERYRELNYPDFEIIVVCDKKVKLPPWSNLRLILTHKRCTGPAEKRDLGIKVARGEICAFIDDDAYPDKNWLKNAIRHFRDPKIVAVGGPGITPSEDSFWQKLGGYIIQSYLCSGKVQYRFSKVNNKLFVVDYPAYNLLVRTKILKKVGGYGCTFYGGEDTFLCLKLIRYGKIIYDPEVVVHHHRRAFLLPHLRQISLVGWHRGYFFKKFPETSRQLIYLLPSGLTIGFFSGLFVSIIRPEWFLAPFIALLAIFWLIGSWSIYRHKAGFLSSLIGGIGIIATHVAYGLNFIRGLLMKRVTR